ncbi:hypothetical protein F4859DRAFT_468448 [Xylaria cf. heliscus]|nr:hypothetical protein F4859DRAFT_468448 [Xylaria cf. heliscus]
MSSPAMEDCISCLEPKPRTDFPQAPLTPNCMHPTTTCLACVASFLESQSKNGLISRLSCPQCSELLTYDSIQDFATADTFERYNTYSINELISKTHTLTRCPSCGSKTAHSGAATHQRGITLCTACDRQFCPIHNMPWHADFTCAEYDHWLLDPGFRSRAQVAFTHEEARGAQHEALTQQIKDADDEFAYSLLGARQAARARARLEKRERGRREAAEKAAREERVRREREEAVRLLRRRREEDELSEQRLSRMNKCPGCGVPIEKNGGCPNMTCIRCGCKFDWLGNP